MTLPTIAILGATGQQGRAVLDHFCAHHGEAYTIRAVVRDPTAAAAKTGSNASKVQYVCGNYTDAASLRTAFDGAEYVFAMTSPDMSFTGLEEQWGRNIADAVRNANSVRLLVFSSAPDATAISGGTLECANFAGKAAAQRYMVEIGIPAVFVWPGFFMQNHVPGKPGQPRRVNEKQSAVVFDTLNPAKYIGASIPLVGDWLTFPELATRWARTTGVPPTSRRITEDEFAAPFGPDAATANPVCKMLLEMYRFVNQYGYYKGNAPESLLAPTTSWETFVRRHWPAVASPAASLESTWTPAQTAIARYFRIFDKTQASLTVSEPSELFAPNGIVSFPFAPEGYANKHVGTQAIKAYYSTWNSIFQFYSWTPLVPRAIGDNGAIVEIECRGSIKTTGKAYDQKYVGVAQVDDAGKITQYTEYWDVSKLSAFTP
ncbi:hypothetical protein HDU87_005773 [Geranomyces variabilis]|uniref:Uncharacterized protein n=1 Tax=Geranomyces variabilis TaxID=109894 RepID=A0AAD5TGE0_9FUNG|nr:hypothetical protein HDU87_005773 [Geranomyces variabilis]